jgi:hypothetical protein
MLIWIIMNIIPPITKATSAPAVVATRLMNFSVSDRLVFPAWVDLVSDTVISRIITTSIQVFNYRAFNIAPLQALIAARG